MIQDLLRKLPAGVDPNIVIVQATKCNSPEEIIALGKTYGVEIEGGTASLIFEKIQKVGVLDVVEGSRRGPALGIPGACVSLCTAHGSGSTC